MKRRYAVVLETGLPNPFAVRHKGPFRTRRAAVRFAKKTREGLQATVIKAVWRSR